MQALHRLVRDREVLRADFARIWPRVADAEHLGAWISATLELSNVNAGPVCIVAFWRATRPDRLALVADAGHAAAEICRLAGARAALACLDTLPTAMRLTGADAEALAAWWRGLRRLGQEAPRLVQDVARRVQTFLAQGDGAAFADFVAAGLKATARDRARRAAFFALDDPLAQSLLARATAAAGFADSERMLTAFATGLWGGTPRLQAAPPAATDVAPRTMIAAGTVLLPPLFPGVAASRVRALYRAAVAHAQAHLAAPASHLPLGQPVAGLRPVQVALVGLIEDARVEALAIRRHPGLRQLWAGFHDARPGALRSATALMARLARALLDPSYPDPDGFVRKGRALFADAASRLDDPAISREIGAVLGNDLGQLRLTFNARTYAVEPTYRCDNLHLWALPETPDDSFAMTVETARATDGDTGGDQQGHAGAGAPRAREAGIDARGIVLATYPEWDSVAGVERPDWTTLRDTMPKRRPPSPSRAGEAALRARIARLVQASVIGSRTRQHPREAGEELDIDAAIRALAAQRGGIAPDPRLYRDRRPKGRDLATLIILDVSQSTAATSAAGQSVLDAERLAVAALAAALQARGERHAIRAFASAGREDVRLTRIKDFDETLSPAVGERLAGLSSELSTRLGAALRHAGAELAKQRTTRKLLLVLTDGEPSDIDVARPEELVEDARRAARHLRLQGIDVFGLVIDPEQAGSAATIFGRHNSMNVRRLEELPGRLAGVYFRLAQR